MSAFRVCINAECCLFISLVIVRAAHRWCFAIFEGGVHVSMGHEGRGKEGGLLARGARGGGRVSALVWWLQTFVALPVDWIAMRWTWRRMWMCACVRMSVASDLWVPSADMGYAIRYGYTIDTMSLALSPIHCSFFQRKLPISFVDFNLST